MRRRAAGEGRGGDAAIAAFLAAGGKVTRCGEITRSFGFVSTLRKTGDGRLVMIRLNNGGLIALYERDYGLAEPPKMHGKVSFEVIHANGLSRAVNVHIWSSWDRKFVPAAGTAQ